MSTQADLEAVAQAIREHDRFLVTSHENPDGDALGSLAAMHRALVQLGKDSVMYLAGPAPLPARGEALGSARANAEAHRRRQSLAEQGRRQSSETSLAQRVED